MPILFCVFPPSANEDIMRLVYEGEVINKNMHELDAIQDRLWRMSNLRIRKPRAEESKRIVQVDSLTTLHLVQFAIGVCCVTRF